MHITWINSLENGFFSPHFWKKLGGIKFYRTFAPDLNKVIMIKKGKNLKLRSTCFSCFIMTHFDKLISVTITKS